MRRQGRDDDGAGAPTINGVGEIVQQMRDVEGDQFLLKVKVGGDESEQSFKMNSVNYGGVVSLRW